MAKTSPDTVAAAKAAETKAVAPEKSPTTMNSRERKISFKQAAALGIGSLLLCLAFHLLDRHVYIQASSPSFNIDRFKTNTTFIRRDIPITYYKKGRLADVLPKGGWVTDPGDAGLRVFRLEPGEEFEFDANKLKGSIGAKKVLECSSDHGLALCPDDRCVEPSFKDVDVADILSGKDRESYAAFAYMEQSSVDHIEEALQLPFKMDRGRFEQAFISNGIKDTFYTILHANPVTHSLAIQLVGRKYWIVFRRDDYIKSDGFKAAPHAGPLFVSKAPDCDTMEYYAYASQPGDLFFFPPAYGHAVASSGGPNAMVNFRKPLPLTLLKHLPMTTLHNIFNLIFFGSIADKVQRFYDEGEEDRGQVFQQAQGHTSKMTQFMFDLTAKVCCANDDPDNIDRILARLMKDLMKYN